MRGPSSRLINFVRLFRKGRKERKQVRGAAAEIFFSRVLHGASSTLADHVAAQHAPQSRGFCWKPWLTFIWSECSSLPFTPEIVRPDVVPDFWAPHFLPRRGHKKCLCT